MPRLNVELLVRCTGHAGKRRRDETVEQFLSRVTHLYCADKGIETIENLSNCRRVSVLYLYDNCINKIDGLDCCANLTHLYMQNNNIRVLENLSSLYRLTKLYLSHNTISVVEGLTELACLSELHIAHQKLPEGEVLHFDPRSLQAIAPRLLVLNVSGNRLNTIEDLSCLTELTQFQATDNQLSSMKELARVFSRWPRLQKLELMRNPLTSRYKYHDRVVTMCYCLEMLDGREIGDLERQFLFSWKAMRKSRHRQVIKPAVDHPDSSRLPALFAGKSIGLPALPARQPIRSQTQKKKQESHVYRVRLPHLSGDFAGGQLTSARQEVSLQNSPFDHVSVAL